MSALCQYVATRSPLSVVIDATPRTSRWPSGTRIMWHNHPGKPGSEGGIRYQKLTYPDMWLGWIHILLLETWILDLGSWISNDGSDKGRQRTIIINCRLFGISPPHVFQPSMMVSRVRRQLSRHLSQVVGMMVMDQTTLTMRRQRCVSIQHIWVKHRTLSFQYA